MFGGRKGRRTERIDTLVGQSTQVTGDVVFSGGLHIDGTVHGNVQAADDSDSVLTISENGLVEGEVHVPHVVLNGKVVGDVYAAERIELAARARVQGNVYYNLIEMAMGAEVNGSLVHQTQSQPQAKAARSDKEKIVEPAMQAAAGPD